MPIFLSQADLYRVLQRELPEDVYADGAPSAFFSTADMNAVAKPLATAYENLERIYDNYFPQYADENVGDWEVTVFGFVSDGDLTLQQRRDRVIAKLRNRPGITRDDIFRAVTATIPELAPTGFDIIVWGCSLGGWTLDVSELGYDTYLNGYPRTAAVGPQLCDLTPGDFGVTEAQWIEMQTEAYTYEIRIAELELTEAQLQALDTVLTAAEPARSTHVITQAADYLSTEDGDTLVTEDGDPIEIDL